MNTLRELGDEMAMIFGRPPESTRMTAPSLAVRMELRRMLGRPLGCWVQYDVGLRAFRKPVPARDPILDLYVARSNARLGPANAERYGVIRQLAVSPVVLP